jgi:hypothetical protein
MQLQLKEGRVTWKQGWFEIDGKRMYLKSNWERRYALYLSLMLKYKHITDYWYEPETFYFKGIKRGTTNYKPDWKVLFPSGNFEFIEVKGYLDAKSATKIKRMAKYFPELKLRVVDATWFKTNALMLKKVLKNW